MMKIPDGFNIIEIRKELSKIIHDSKVASKPMECLICGKTTESFCNSHSVPRMVLKSIADKGKLLQANVMIGIEALDIEKGINNSGTFHCICNDCDSKIFKDYEDSERITNYPLDSMMAEIALKDSLYELIKRKHEVEMFKKCGIENSLINRTMELDISEYSEEIELYKGIILNDDQGQFEILYWSKLPYIVPYATQTCFALSEDMYGNMVNDNFYYSSNTRMEKMHICIFPLKSESVILAFYHKRNTKYRILKGQLNIVSDEQALRYINWLVIKNTENIFIAKELKQLIDNNQELQKLSQDVFGVPNLGLIDSISDIINNKPVGVDDIPNLLDKEYSIKR